MPRIRRQTNRCRLQIESLEQRLVLAWDLAADFAADFVGNLPQNNPNGAWTYLATDGTTASLLATDGGSPSTFGVGAGWAEAMGVPSYARAATHPPFQLPAGTMSGHGPNWIVWTAPSDATMGGIEISGLVTQATFEPDRQMRLKIFKNDFAGPFITVDADFDVQNTVVPIPTTRVAVEPGDTLTIFVDGSGPLGNGVSTFSSFNVHLEEIDPEIDADFSGDFKVDDQDYDIWAANVGMNLGATHADGDADGDGDVDGDDFLIWQRQFGNEISSGAGSSESYYPGAVIVQMAGVTLPGGIQLDVTGTQTQGLQEAFDYAADEGWDVFVLPGTYNLDASIDIQPVQGKAFRLEDVTLNFSSLVTDHGLRFDSTMITDWYWDGGALNALHATSGVLFDPENPHPLDGIILGTRGVVDSRFNFNVPIAAATNGVTMNTIKDQAPFVSVTINDVNFHFDNITQSQINYEGSGFASNNTFGDTRTDDPIPFDLFSTNGRVTMVPPAGVIGSGPGTVFKPDGTTLSTLGTSTSGLQEAFDYAAANDLDVLVFGRGIRGVDPMSNLGLYDLHTTLRVSDLTNRIYRIYSVTFNYNGVGTIMEFGDLVSSDFELTGQIVGAGAAIGAHIRPTSAGVTDSLVRIQHVVFADTNVLIDPSLSTIADSEFYFHELNIGDVGITVATPATLTFFQNNFVRTNHTHAMTDTGIQIGESAVNSNNIHLNDFVLRTSTDGGAAAAVTGVSVWGAFNTLDYVVLEPGQQVGVKFETASNDNALTHGQITAVTPIIDRGTNNTCNGGPCAGNAPRTSMTSESDWPGVPYVPRADGRSARRSNRLIAPVLDDRVGQERQLPTRMNAADSPRATLPTRERTVTNRNLATGDEVSPEDARITQLDVVFALIR